jgi:hypothetical protein
MSEHESSGWAVPGPSYRSAPAPPAPPAPAAAAWAQPMDVGTAPAPAWDASPAWDAPATWDQPVSATVGWGAAPPPDAGAATAQRRQALARKGRRSIRTGAALIVLGLAVWIGSYAIAVANGGGTYFISYMPIVYGTISLFTGLRDLRASER